MNSDLASQVTVIIPSKTYCPLARRAVVGIRRLYPDLRVLLLIDEIDPVDHDDPNTQQLVSPSPILGAKRNYGVAQAHTPYLAFIDSDAIPEEGWLDNALAQFASDPEIGIVGGPNILYPDSTRQEYLSWLACKSYLVAGGNVHEKVRSPTKWVNSLPSCNMVVPVALYQDLGGFSEGVITGEDIEFCIKVRGSGKKILFCEDVVVFHKTRSFKGYCLQRYVWGKSTFDVLKLTYPHYLTSILPFLFISGLIALATLGAFWPVYWLLLGGVVAFYIGAVVWECLRVGTGLVEKMALFRFVLAGNFVPGIGAVVAFIVGDSIRSYTYYRNDD